LMAAMTTPFIGVGADSADGYQLSASPRRGVTRARGGCVVVDDALPSHQRRLGI
jgi:hypothetical protein